MNETILNTSVLETLENVFVPIDRNKGLERLNDVTLYVAMHLWNRSSFSTSHSLLTYTISAYATPSYILIAQRCICNMARSTMNVSVLEQVSSLCVRVILTCFQNRAKNFCSAHESHSVFIESYRRSNVSKRMWSIFSMKIIIESTWQVGE